MRRKIFYTLLIPFCFILQTTVFRGRFFSGTPNLLLASVVSIAFLYGRSAGALAGFFAGLLFDLYGGNVAGLYALLFTACGYICGRYENIYFEKSIRMPVLAAFLCDAACGSAACAALFLLRGRTALPRYFLHVILPGAAVTAFFTAILYFAVSRIDQKARRYDERRKKNAWLRE